MLSDQQDFKKADEYFKKALDVDPHNATAYVHRGKHFSKWNLFEMAIITFETNRSITVAVGRQRRVGY